jgi:hypothetical protein
VLQQLWCAVRQPFFEMQPFALPSAWRKWQMGGALHRPGAERGGVISRLVLTVPLPPHA